MNAGHARCDLSHASRHSPDCDEGNGSVKFVPQRTSMLTGDAQRASVFQLNRASDRTSNDVASNLFVREDA